MSQHWPSINSSKRSDDSTRRSSSKTKINKLRVSLGLSSPKSFSILKNTPNQLITNSILSSMSSVNKAISEIPGVNSKNTLNSYSSIANKCSYRLDAAMLIISRIKKFIYKHFHIWRLAVGRTTNNEKRNHSAKSLVIQVTVNEGKKRFHSISKSSFSTVLSEKSPRSVKAIDRPLRIQDLEDSFGKKQKILKNINSQQSFRKKFQFNSFDGTDWKKEKNFRIGFDFGPVKPVGRNFVNFAAKEKKMQRVVEILGKKWGKLKKDCFFAIFYVFIFRLNLLKILANMMRKLKKRMRGVFEDILKSSERIGKGKELIKNFSKVGKGLIRGYFTRIVFCLKSKVNARESFEILKKTIIENNYSRARVSRYRNSKILSEKAKNFKEIIERVLKNEFKSCKNFAFQEIKNIFYREEHFFSSPEYSCICKDGSRVLKVYESKDALIRKSLGQFRKNIMKEVNFRCKKCFVHWKNQAKLLSSKDISDLKVKTVANILNEIFFKNLKVAFGYIRKYRGAGREISKVTVSVKVLKALKRISKHLNFFKAKAFQKFKHFRPFGIGKKIESKLCVISQFVKILKGKLVRNFRFFCTQVTRN